MSGMENPQIKAVRHFENAIDTIKPGVHRQIRNWVFSLLLESPKLDSAIFYQGNPDYIIDRVRTFPFIEEADHFFKPEFKKNPFESILSQYQTSGKWNYENRTQDNLKTFINNDNLSVQSLISTAIEDFGKLGNIRGLTNLFYYAEESNMSIPPHIQLEALFWAEACLAKNLLEQESNLGRKKIIRVSEVRKKDEEQKFLEKDPVLHLFRAYRLAEMLEAISIE